MTMPADIDKIKELQARLNYYEQDGAAKLFYSLNRKAAELADILNKNNLTNLDLSDAKDKTFERIKVAISESVNIATAVKSLEQVAGITNNELSDTNKPVYKRPITSETMADAIGELAGQR